MKIETRMHHGIPDSAFIYRSGICTALAETGADLLIVDSNATRVC